MNIQRLNAIILTVAINDRRPRTAAMIFACVQVLVSIGYLTSGALLIHWTRKVTFSLA